MVKENDNLRKLVLWHENQFLVDIIDHNLRILRLRYPKVDSAKINGGKGARTRKERRTRGKGGGTLDLGKFRSNHSLSPCIIRISLNKNVPQHGKTQNNSSLDQNDLN
jgi:hypothetical protein